MIICFFKLNLQLNSLLPDFHKLKIGFIFGQFLDSVQILFKNHIIHMDHEKI